MPKNLDTETETETGGATERQRLGAGGPESTLPPTRRPSAQPWATQAGPPGLPVAGHKAPQRGDTVAGSTGGPALCGTTRRIRAAGRGVLAGCQYAGPGPGLGPMAREQQRSKARAGRREHKQGHETMPDLVCAIFGVAYRQAGERVAAHKREDAIGLPGAGGFWTCRGRGRA